MTTEKLRMNLQKYCDKNNTPRVYQIISTIAFVNLSILMAVLEPFCLFDIYSLAGWFGGSNVWSYETIFGFFWYSSLHDFGEVLAIITVVAASIAGIVFMWMNRPKISGICGGVLLLIMLLSLIHIWGFDYVIQRRNHGMDDTFLDVDVQGSYYALWGSLVLLAVFVVLAIVFTKKGPRQPKVVKIVETSTAAISSADEIKKLKDLCDSGVITQEEFDAKKKELLGL